MISNPLRTILKLQNYRSDYGKSSSNDYVHYIFSKITNNCFDSKLFPFMVQLMDISSSNERKIPQYACGYSNSDANKYKDNRINQLGSYKPFLIKNKMNMLSEEIRREIALLICDTIKLFKIKGDFQESPKEKKYGSVRLKMRREFWEYMGMTESDESYFPFFLIEGFSFISEAMIKFHMDNGNDHDIMFSKTYSLKTKIVITPKIADIPAMKKFMKHLSLSIGDFFPLSLMMYSKKIVGDHVLRMNKVAALLNHDVEHDSSKLTSVMLRAIMDPEAPENYRRLWDNPTKICNNLSDMKQSSGGEEKCGQRKQNGKLVEPPTKVIPTQFDGHYTLTKPAFDKSVSVFMLCTYSLCKYHYKISP